MKDMNIHRHSGEYLHLGCNSIVILADFAGTAHLKLTGY